MKKILVVDDEMTIRQMVQEMLAMSGFQVILAESGVHAMTILSDEKIDLVITDIVMPQENGIDLIMDMKKVFPSIPVIAMSGGGGIEGRFNYLEIAKLVGANVILEKPFSKKTLENLVEKLLNH